MWKTNGKGTPDALRTGNTDRTLVQCDDFVDDREPDSHAATMVRFGVLSAVEALEEVGERFLGYAYTAILHRNTDLVGGVRDRYGHGCRWLTILQGVLEQI